MMHQALLRIAIPAPLRRQFDYLPPSDCHVAGDLQAGIRVRVPFGKQTLVGILLEVVSQSEIPTARLRRAHAILDETPLLDNELLEFLLWGSQYYQHPVGEVLLNALPVKLRQGEAAVIRGITRWRTTTEGRKQAVQELKRAPRQRALLHELQQHPHGLDTTHFNTSHVNWREAMKKLVEKGWVESFSESALPRASATTVAPPLNPEQQQAISAISAQLGQFQPFLLEGVTGSGKTEVYLGMIEKVLQQGKQALVLVPEIGLTPQLLQRFQCRLNARIAMLHSGLNDEERMQAWLSAREDKADVIIGTRSAVFAPLLRPGLIIIDEEHDLSFKQQDGFRYSARDMAVVRARKLDVPVVLGSATPSLESLFNARQQRYQTLLLPQRAVAASPPPIHLLDIRSQKMEHGLSAQLLKAIETHLDRHSQVLLFINRRGFAPVLMCHACGWHARCHRCDAHMTLHQHSHKLRCHHCGSEQGEPQQCPKCEADSLLAMGYGTERVEQTLQERFARTPIIRIDRDSTRRKGSLQSLLEEIQRGDPAILIGTQMLAKGHHFPNVTLVGILNVDQGFYSADFRGAERMGQLILQVAGRAGREEKPGEVLIQTHHPEHPLFTPLLQHDYSCFAETLLEERQLAEMPPFSHFALLRAEAVDAQSPMQFLHEARKALPASDRLLVMGPFPAPMERRAGRFRAQLLLQGGDRKTLHQPLPQWLLQLEQLKSSRKVRWSLDIDPQETF